MPDDDLTELEQDCERMNRQAVDAVGRLEALLVAGLAKDVRVRWDRLINAVEFREPVPIMPALEVPEKPDMRLKPDASERPSADDPKYTLDEGVLYSLVPWLKEKKLQELEQQYQADLETYKKRAARWNQLVLDYRDRLERAKKEYANRMLQYREAERQYHARRAAFLERVAAHNATINRERAAYEQGDAGGVARAMTRVLMNSELPAEFPDVVDIDFDQSEGVLRVVRALPAFDDLPSVRSYRVIKKDRELREQPLSDAARK